MVSENGTLLDALASCGDLTTFGNRKNIKVIRGDSVYYLDITEMNVLKSAGFFLQSNDVIYVEPVRRKNTLANFATVNTVISFSSLLVTITTTIIFLTR